VKGGSRVPPRSMLACVARGILTHIYVPGLPESYLREPNVLCQSPCDEHVASYSFLSNFPSFLRFLPSFPSFLPDLGLVAWGGALKSGASRIYNGSLTHCAIPMGRTSHTFFLPSLPSFLAFIPSLLSFLPSILSFVPSFLSFFPPSKIYTCCVGGHPFLRTSKSQESRNLITGA